MVISSANWMHAYFPKNIRTYFLGDSLLLYGRDWTQVAHLAENSAIQEEL